MKKKNVIEIFIVVAILMAAAFMTSCFEVSDGIRSGNLIKFSKKGIFCKTYEGQLLLGAQGGATNTWDFSVENETLAQSLSAKIGQNVLLHYKQEFAKNPCRGDTGYFVDSEK